MKIAKNKLKEKYQEETGGKQIQIINKGRKNHMKPPLEPAIARASKSQTWARPCACPYVFQKNTCMQKYFIMVKQCSSIF